MSKAQRSSRLTLSPEEAAEALGISLPLLEKLTKDGDIPFVRFTEEEGDSKREIVRYTPAELKRWLRERAEKELARMNDGIDLSDLLPPIDLSELLRSPNPDQAS
jgi:excisionase family DNA binding protein